MVCMEFFGILVSGFLKTINFLGKNCDHTIPYAFFEDGRNLSAFDSI